MAFNPFKLFCRWLISPFVVMRVIHKLIVTVSILMIGGITNAQVSFITKTSAATIGKNEFLEVNYEVHNGTVDDFEQPAFKEWKVAGGPNISSSTFISNGEKTTSLSYQFLLKPLKAGQFIIPGARAVINGKLLSSNTISITVSNKNTTSSGAPHPGPLLDPMLLLPPELEPEEDHYENYDGFLLREDENILEKTKKNLFVLVDVSKKTCYPGEAVKAVYQLYSRVNLDAHITKRPSFSGFSTVDLPEPTNSEFEIVNRNGKQFKVYNVRSVQLYPLLTGSQILEEVEIEATVQYRKVYGQQPGLFYDPYAPSNTINYPYVIKSDPVVVEVIPFPTKGKPAGFNGVTGKFNITSSLNQPELSRNEAGSLKVEITGSGNWAMLQAPKINWPDDVDVYEPSIKESLDSQAIPITGTRVYEYPFSTDKPGKFTIPSINLTFFNPEQKQYESINTQSFTVEVSNNRKPQHAMVPATYKGLSGADNTKIFTDIVKIAFPVTAILLALGLIIKFRRRKKIPVQQSQATKTGYLPDQGNPSQPGTSNFERFTPGGNPFKEKPLMVDTLPSSPSKPVFPGVTEPTSIVNELPGTSEINSGAYFTTVKKEILSRLQQQWEMPGKQLVVTAEALRERGFTPGEAEKITDMLTTCERYIYSPFNENFDRTYYDELLAVILVSINRSKYNK